VKLPTLEDLPDPKGKRVLLRVDFNVPISDGKIDDDLRITAALPTIEWLVDHGAAVDACAHLGRPKGQPDDKYSLDPVRERLADLAPDVELMENLRFDAGEEANDDEFVARLVDGHDLYVNDAFGACHRAHASVVGPPKHLPSAAGRLLAREVEVLSTLLTEPARPFVAVLGGAKVSDKLGVIKALLDKVDVLVIGGGMCFTFLAAQGHSVGDSLLQRDQIDACRELLETGKKILLPTDVVAMGRVRTRRSPRRAWTSPTGARASTSGPRAPPPSPTSSPAPAPCCGTAPWACSRTSVSPPAPGRSPRRWPAPTGSPWSAEETVPPPWPSSGSLTVSTTSPPAEGPRSSSSNRATCPG